MRKINIHLTLQEDAIEYSRSVNMAIRNITCSEIVFDESSPMIPHITLVMGMVRDNISLEEIATITRRMAAETKPIRSIIRPPYLETKRNRYVFSDVFDGEILAKLKRDFYTTMVPEFLTTQSDYTDQPHITLAHVTEKQEKVVALLQTFSQSIVSTSPEIEISDTGSKGTCINSLYKFKLYS